jgi:peroxin-6
LLYLGVSDTHDAQLKILEALTRKFRLHLDLNLWSVAEQCPFNFTGADIYALCSDAMLKAMTRKASEVDIRIGKVLHSPGLVLINLVLVAALNSQPPQEDHPYPITPQYYLAKMATDGETDVVVALEDFENALRELVPSVSQTEMEHYRSVQARFTKAIDKNGEALTDGKPLFFTAQSSNPRSGPSHHDDEAVFGPIAKNIDKGKGRVPVDVD